MAGWPQIEPETGNRNRFSMKPATERFTMKPVSVKPVFIETGLKPVLKPVLNELKPV